MKLAAFLLSLLAEHFDRKHVQDEKTEQRWRKEMEELEATLPEPAERTVEQWEQLVHLTGELYYAMAAHSNTFSATMHLEKLKEALDEIGGQ